MSQYKVLPSYTDLTSFNDLQFQYLSSDLHHVPVIFSAQVGGDRLHLDTSDHQLQQVPVDMDSSLVSGDQPYIFPWEHETVQNVQDTLNSQPSIYQYPPPWSETEGKFMEDEETLDLSTTSTILSYSYSPTRPLQPPTAVTNTRLTILPPRTQMLDPATHHPSHQVSPQMQPHQHHQQHPQQQQVQQPALASTSIKHDKERRVRARPRSVHEQREIERPCKVCGEKAGKHSYYGGQVCPSCRAFFRRSVQSGYNATYYCVKEGDCQVTLKTRKNCQYCRYRLCEMAGMKTSWVLTEEERKLKFAGKGKKRKDRISSGSVSQGDNGQVPSNTCDQGSDIHHMPMLGLCESDLADIQTYVLASGCYEVSRVADMDTQLIRKIIRMIAFKASLDLDGQAQLRQVILSRCHKFVTKLQEFNNLSLTDSQQLVTSNLNLVTSLVTCSMFPPSLLWSSQLASLLGEGEVDKLNTKLRSLNVMGLDTMHLDYVQFFGLPLGLTLGDETVEKFLKLVRDIGSWHQDPTELVLLSLVIFFTTDTLDLTDRSKVDETQMTFALLLQKYISIKYQNDPEMSRLRFTKGMMLIMLVREMIEIQTTFNSTSHLDTLQEL